MRYSSHYSHVPPRRPVRPVARAIAVPMPQQQSQEWIPGAIALLMGFAALLVMVNAG